MNTCKLLLTLIYVGGTPSQSHCFTQVGQETFLREAPCASLVRPCGPGLASGQLSESACEGGRGGKFAPLAVFLLQLKNGWR